jgi:Protein of unknown function (DUF3224)
MTTLKATFEVTSWDEQPFDEQAGLDKLARASVGKNYSGEVEGSSVTEWLMAYSPDSRAAFVGLERITGSVGGNRGSLVLRHVGSYADGVAKADLAVVSGTDQLADLAGHGTMVADPGGRVSLTIEVGSA